MLLVFFASLGLGAHFSRLLSAGRGVVVIVAAISVAIVAQNAAGIALASAFGDPPTLGLFLGSIAYLGGHGATVAWAGSPFAQGLGGALEAGIASATLGLVLGGVVAGPLAVWLLTRRTAGALQETTFAAGAEVPASSEPPPFSSDRWLNGILWIAVAIGGALLRDLASGAGWNLPGFLTAMAVAIVITNAADVLRRPVDTEVTHLIGTVALRVFLAFPGLSDAGGPAADGGQRRLHRLRAGGDA
jgi:ESS family glutamate:Na+ symporter